MAKQIVMTLAMSLDGYIVDELGGFEWIKGDDDHTLDTEMKWDYQQFLSSIDLVIMGKRCYEQDMHLDFKNKPVLVASHEPKAPVHNLSFIQGDIVQETLEYMGQHHLESAFLFGGGGLLDAFIKADIIDEYIIGIVPIILGRGRKLFYDNNPVIKLHLKKVVIEEGVTILTYTKR